MRLRNLQALRGIACLLVVFAHLSFFERRQEAQPPFFAPLDYIGFGAVDLLFVLSGFVITWSNANALGRPRRFAGYLGRRLWRVFPVYWACWLAALPLAHRADRAAYLLTHRAIWPMWSDLALVPTFRTNLAMPQAWTMLYEVSFYIVFAGFVVLPRRAFVPCLIVWSAISVGGLVFPAVAMHCTIDYGYVAAWVWRPSFLKIVLGCFVALAVRRGWTGGGRTALVAGLAGLAAAAVVAYRVPGAWGRFEPFMLPAALLIYAAVAVERTRGWVLPRWLWLVGDASFPIYLIHLAVFEFGDRHFGGTGPTVLGHLTWLALMTGAALAAGFALHAAIERPVLDLARPRKRSPGPPVEVPALRRAA